MELQPINKTITRLLFAALFFWGCERDSGTSNPINIIPPVPSGAAVYFAYDGEILLFWNGDVSNSTKFYTIFRSVGDTLHFSLLAVTAKDYYYDDSLYYDSTYFYKLKATSFSNEESDFSTIVSGTPKNIYPPKKIMHFSSEGRNWEGDKYFFLSWEPLSESDIAGYNIYRSIDENFSADSSSYLGFSANSSYNDRSDTSVDKRYYYKIRGLDKGGLIGKESDIAYDEINDIPVMIFPANGSTVEYFNYFIIRTINKAADYLIQLQTNPYYGEIWSEKFSSDKISDSLQIKLKSVILYPYTDYYWRIITFSKDKKTPNSISPVYSFRIKL